MVLSATGPSLKGSETKKNGEEIQLESEGCQYRQVSLEAGSNPLCWVLVVEPQVFGAPTHQNHLSEMLGW